MPSNSIPLFEDSRLLVLQAAQNGDFAAVQSLIETTPSLLQARTTTKQSSLLHIAAQRGHLEICQFLIAKGHGTNPINCDGQTPYLFATKAEIKQLLKKKHMLTLCHQFFSVETTESIVCEASQSLEREKFMERFGEVTFPFPFTRTCPSSGTLVDSGRPIFIIETWFRTDILMMPFIGELLVIHANTIRSQLDGLLRNFIQAGGPISISDHSTTLDRMIPVFVFYAHFVFVHEGLQRFEFLNHPISSNDTSVIVETKKFFITYGVFLLKECYQAYSSASPDISGLINQMRAIDPDSFDLIMTKSDRILHENANALESIQAEMHEKYIGERAATARAVFR